MRISDWSSDVCSSDLGVALARAKAPAFAVIDLRLEDGNGLDVVEALRARRPDARIIVLTGSGAIATAVAAVKLGAVDYLSKPADADAIEEIGRATCRERVGQYGWTSGVRG